MSARIRLIMTAIALAIPFGVLFYWTLVFHPHEMRFEIETIAPSIGEYQFAKDEPLTPDVLAQIEPDRYMMRLYQDSNTASLWLYAAFYRGFASTAAHDPAVCYPAQGWDISESRDLNVEMSDGESMRARLLRVQLNGLEERVLYWFQPVGRWPVRASIEQLLRVYDGLRGTPQYAFVRLSIPASVDSDDETSLFSFAREVAPQVRAILENATSS